MFYIDKPTKRLITLNNLNTFCVRCAGVPNDAISSCSAETPALNLID